jgi:hypothetical protein
VIDLKKFIILYTSPMSVHEQMENSNPEEMKKVMGEWMAWGDKNKSALIDFGTPLGKSIKVTKDGQSDLQTSVAGYSILSAESLEQVGEMLKDHPHLNMPGGCEVEVHECLPVPGME